MPGTLDENGPQGLTASLVGGESAMAYTSEDVMAATFNRELVAEMGKCIGEISSAHPVTAKAFIPAYMALAPTYTVLLIPDVTSNTIPKMAG